MAAVYKHSLTNNKNLGEAGNTHTIWEVHVYVSLEARSMKVSMNERERKQAKTIMMKSGEERTEKTWRERKQLKLKR
jgi:hypothetical protein